MSKKADKEILSINDAINLNSCLRAIEFMATSTPLPGDRDAEVREICKALYGIEIQSADDLFKTLAKSCEAQDTPEAWTLFRRFLGKMLGAATRDLHFKAKAVEQKQRSGRLKDQYITVGEVETYNVMPWDDVPFTVSEHFYAVEDLNVKIDAWNIAICGLLGWNIDTTDPERFTIPFVHVPVDTAENLAKAPQDRDYRPIYSLSEALMELDRGEERKAEARRKAAKGMIAALLAS